MDGASIVGRERELEAISTFLELDSDGGGAFVLEGEAGIGKTTLWRAATSAASANGCRVIETRPSLAEATLAFSGLGDLLASSLDEVAAGLPGPQLAALEIALLRREAEGLTADPRAVSAGVLGVLRALAGSSAVAVAVDDVQWLDHESAEALAYAFRRIDEEPVRLVASLRLDPSLRPSPLLDAIAIERTTRVRVGPMSSGALQRAIRIHLDRTLPRPVLLRVHELAGGNPFYGLELARSLPEDPGARIALPPSLEGVTRERLERLPAAVRRLLEPAALLADPTVDLLEALSSGSDGVGERLDVAVSAAVIEISGGSVRFTHPLLAESIAETTGPRRRAELHARLATLIDEPEQRARHLALATTRRDAATARAIEDGSRAAMTRGAPAAAGELLEAAAALTPTEDRPERWRRTIDAARAFYDAGLWARAKALVGDCLADAPPGVLRADALVTLGELTTESLEAADRAFQEALRNASGDDARLSVIHRRRASLVFVRTGSVALWREHTALALDTAMRTGDPTVIVPALSEIGFADLCAGRFERDGLDHALELQRRTPMTLHYFESPRFVLGMHFLYVDRLDEARAMLRVIADDAAARGNDPARSALLLHLVELECRAGNFEAAGAYADACRLLAEQHGDEHTRTCALYGQAFVAAHLGQVTAARAAAEQGVAISEEIGDHVFRVQNLAVLGFLELGVGDLARADEVLRPLPSWLIEHGWNDPSVCPAWPNAIEALIGVGELDLASEYLLLYEERARRCDCPWALATGARCLGLLRLATADLAGALQALEQSLHEHRRTPGQFERGRTLLALGSTLRHARRRKDARETLQQALATFDELGTVLWAEKARGELARVGGRSPAGDALTPSEQRIADLVADGKTNKEVAAELFVTARTVEGHLTRIYEKLGVRSRVELARRVRTPTS